jgi:UDP-glucose 4-epimerase
LGTNKIKAKFALVTGGAGFIGSHLVDRLVYDGWGVRILDNFSSGRMENIEHHRGSRKVEILKGDLKNPEEAKKAVRDVDLVFHYAANPEVRLSTTNPEIHFGENVLATFNLLEAIRKNEVEELVFASSSSVYGEPENIPVGENSPIKPVSVYGASKAACENLIHAYSNLYGLKARVLRYANVVGPRLRHGVIYDFIVKLGKNPKQLEILGDGTQTRSYIYIDDAVEATLIANNMVGRRFEAYNVGSEDCITVKEVADIVVDALGLKDVKYVYKPVEHGIGWRGDVKNIALSIDKVKGLGYKPKLSCTEAVRKTTQRLKREILF